MLIVISYFNYDLYAMFLVFRKKTEIESQSGPHQIKAFITAQPLLVVHHLAIGAIFTPMMTFYLDHEPGELMIACALIFEASTPFVSFRAILASLDLKKTLLYVVNGMMMVLVFFCCRILVYPIFYFAYARQRDIGFFTAVGSTPTNCAIFMTLVLLPQLYWFNIMVKGAFKVWNDLDRNGSTKANGIKVH